MAFTEQLPASSRQCRQLAFTVGGKSQTTGRAKLPQGLHEPLDFIVCARKVKDQSLRFFRENQTNVQMNTDLEVLLG